MIKVRKETVGGCSLVCVNELACWGINFKSTTAETATNCEILVGTKETKQTIDSWEYHGVLKRTFRYS